MIGKAGADWPRAARPVKVTGTNLYGYNSTDQLGLLKYPQVRYGMPIVAPARCDSNTLDDMSDFFTPRGWVPTTSVTRERAGLTASS